MGKRKIVQIPVSVYHIVGLAVAGQDGRYWYHSEGVTLRTAAERLKVSAEHFASVLAITSPQVPVARNGRITVGFIREGSRWGMMSGVQAALDHYLATGECRKVGLTLWTAVRSARTSSAKRRGSLDGLPHRFRRQFGPK